MVLVWYRVVLSDAVWYHKILRNIVWYCVVSLAFFGNAWSCVVLCVTARFASNPVMMFGSARLV